MGKDTPRTLTPEAGAPRVSVLGCTRLGGEGAQRDLASTSPKGG